ncbi:hypothetical protein HNQ74_001549 [Bartonella doshiae]|nr:hypothetical protein [Bartonella doshiae]
MLLQLTMKWRENTALPDVFVASSSFEPVAMMKS